MSDRPGSATRHWRNQRLTSIALLPLGLWFLISLLRQPELSYEIVAGWFGKPLQAVLGTLFGVAFLWHSMQGVQVVLEDYVSGRLRPVSIALARIVHVAAALVLAFAIYALATGSGR